jgi:hypothetical protein
VNDIALTDIDTYMRNTFSVCIGQEDQISRLQVALFHSFTPLVLISCTAREIDSVFGINILDKSGAVKTAGTGTAPFIRGTDIFPSIRDDVWCCV